MKLFKKAAVLLIIMVMAFTFTAMPALADGETEGETVSDPGKISVTSYSISKIKSDKGKSKSTIEKDYTFDIEIDFMIRTEMETEVSEIIKALDGFEGGTVDNKIDDKGNNRYGFKIKDLKYKGGEKTLNLIVNHDGVFEDVSLNVVECVEYVEPEPEPDPGQDVDPGQNADPGQDVDPGVEPTPDEPSVVLQPSAVFSRNKMKAVRADKDRIVTVNIKNNGSTTMLDPVLEVATSESLMLKGTRTQFELGNIKPGSTRSVDLKIKGMSTILSESQALDLTLKFNYNNGSETVQGTEAGRINIPVKVTKEGSGMEEEKTDAPAPNVIVSGFEYGGSSVAAGSEFGLTITLQNTSKNIAIENIVVAVDGGTDFILNGGTNTFHFEKMPAGGTRSITVPYKVVPTITSSANSVGISVKYEYIDQKRRIPTNAELQVSVPQYQPDKFELGEPVIQMEGIVGEENSITIDYVNKGKSEISNVEATVEGDIDTYMETQKLGNFEPGKSGTIAFSVTPLNEGDNQVIMTISYEDSNGNVKDRVVETTLFASTYDPGQWEDPGMDEPVEPEGGGGIMAHKWIFIPIALVAAIIALIIIKKKRKAAKAKKQAEMMAKWDEEE